MEELYYLVPITDEHIFINNMNMGELCKEKYPLLAEISNVEDKYCYTNEDDSILERINFLSRRYHKLFKIPRCFIVIQKGDRFSELMTNMEITTDSFEDLKKHEVFGTEPILEFFLKSNYEETALKLFKEYGLLGNKQKVRRLA